MLGLAGSQHAAVGGDDLHGEEVVAGETPLAAKQAHATPQREAGHPGRRYLTTRGHQAVELRLCVHVAPVRARPDAGRSHRRVDPNGLHRREVDHQAAVAEGVAGNVVAPAAHRQKEVVLAREVDRGDDIANAETASDERRLLVNKPVPQRTGFPITFVGGLDQPAA